MNVDAQVEQLLEQLLESGGTPEAVCRDCPELLAPVRAAWAQLRALEAEVDCLFPESGSTGSYKAGVASGPSAIPPLLHIAGYEMQGLLGHGGMGVVYKACHLRLNRPVAVKMLLAGVYAQPKDLERFLREAEAVASLQHPHIVQIHDVGDVDGRPYFTMELVEGGSLAHQLKGVPRAPREAATLVATLADAIHVAHQSGIVHRDLKPGNVLLTADGTPKISDFGLARRLEGAEGLTLSGSPMGTPSYMSPEQAQGQKEAIGRATDVYALGAILYELLTGRPPFRSDSTAATLYQVVKIDPVPPHRLNPRVPRDLETICLRCLQKQPHARYPTAADLAADLRRFLRHEPIRARPVGVLGRLARWSRRNPATAFLTGALLMLALVALLTVLWQWRIAVHARASADRMSARLVLDRGIALCEHGDIGPGLLWLARGLEQAEKAGDTQLIPAFRMNLAAWSGRLMVPHVSPTFGASVNSVAFHPDGKRLLVARWHDANGQPGPGQARLWDADTWKPLGPPLEHPRGIRRAIFSPDGTRILTAGVEGTVRLWDTESGRPLGEPIPVGREVIDVAFSPNGKAFATGAYTIPTAGEARIWDVATGQPITPIMQHPGVVQSVAFSPDGSTLLTGCGTIKSKDQFNGGQAQLWDATTGRPIGPVLGQARAVVRVSFSPDGRTIVTGSADGLVLRWIRSTRELISPPLHHFAAIRAIAFSPDGRSLLTGDGGETWPKEPEKAVRLWDLDSGSLLANPWIHPDSVLSVSFRPDGRRFATGCRNGHVFIWNLGNFQPKRRPYLDGFQIGQRYTVARHELITLGETTATFSADGRYLLAGGETNVGKAAIRIMEVPTGEVHDLLPDAKMLQGTAANLSGLAAPLDGMAALRALAGVCIACREESPIQKVAFGVDPSGAVTISEDGTARVWDVPGGRLRTTLPASAANKDFGAILIPQKQTLIIGALRKPLRILNSTTGQSLTDPIVGDGPLRSEALSPNGQILATAGDTGVIQLWEIATGRLLKRLAVLPKEILALRFSPDGQTLLAGSEGIAWLVDVATGTRRGQALPHQDRVWEARFSPDGKRLLTICSDEYRDQGPGTAQLWDAHSGQPLGPPLPHRVANLAAAFDPEGRLVATGGYDGNVRLWDAATGAPVGPALIQSGPISAVAFVAGQDVLAAAGKDGTLALWPVPTARPGSAEEVHQWVQTLTGQHLDESDAVRNLK